MKFPTIREVASSLTECKRYLEKDTDMDVRLQVYPDGDWAIRTEGSSYDLDHRGYWDASSLDWQTNCRELAKELLDQVRDHYHQTPEDAREMDAEGCEW